MDHFMSSCTARGVLSCGYNSTRQTGTRDTTSNVDSFLLVEHNDVPLEKILQVTCGEYFSTFLTEDHLVYSCGQNHHGQCGVGNLDAQVVPTPTLVEALKGLIVTNISCGYYHTIYLLENGQAWTVGCANDGRLGLGPSIRNDLLSPQLIPPQTFNFEEVSKVACGGTYTIFLTSDNNVYSCGWNSYGQLGINSNVTSVFTVQQIKSPTELLRQKIKDVVCGACHTMFLTESNEAWAVGWNTYGQLGIGTLNNQAQAVRVNVNNYSPIHRIICGYYQTYFFCGSETYSCGSNQSGILCRSTDYKTKDKNKKTPRLINSQNFFNKLQVIDVGVGDYHALYLTEDGQVWLCGDNTKGQLGLPNKEYIYPPQPIPSDHVMFNGLGASDRVAFAVGRNHTMIYYTTKEKRELNWMRFRHLMFVATFDSRGFNDCVVKAIN